MTEFKDTEQQLRRFRVRIGAAAGFVLLCFTLLVLRFVYLQILHYQKYAVQAEQNRIAIIPIVPTRGLIMDRNGVVLAKNYSAYTLEITPSKIQGTLNDVIDQLSQIVPIDARDRRRFKRLQEDSKNFASLPIRTGLSDAEMARFVVQRYRFPGVEVRAKLFREYPLGATAAHAVGYVGRISPQDQDRIEQMSEENSEDPAHYDVRRDATNYNGTDFIGKTGIEQSYETELHGLTGSEEVEVTAGGRPVRTLLRKPSIPGDNLVLTLDIGLQEVAEQALAGKRAALVAIEPATGDVLAWVSVPSFDPNLFADGIDQQNWDALNNSPDKPLLNRPLHGTYAPGSTYKPFMALAALTLNKRTPEWGFQDKGFYTVGGHVFRNDVRAGQGWVDMRRSIVVSNDDYYYMLAHEMGVNTIADFMRPWGFGQKTGIDIQGEATGVLPTTEWKSKVKGQRWYDGDTVSLGIGQGYNHFTMLQLAHATATLANNGIAIQPHFLKELINPLTQAALPHTSPPSVQMAVRQQDVDFVKQAMVGVTSSPDGTAYSVFRGAPYLVGGKTGTAQVFSLRGGEYRAHLIPERLRDHALFIAFAPAEHPSIAVALVVENGGWGTQAAAPVVRKVLDYWLVDRFKPGVAASEVAAAAAGAVQSAAHAVAMIGAPGNPSIGSLAASPVLPNVPSGVPAESPNSASLSLPAPLSRMGERDLHNISH